jgi:HD-GYP domain-containing protein (c-di-GMP phosphodiesterase class II)
MRYATRTFLYSFFPIAFLLIGSFWSIRSVALSTLHDGLRSSLRQVHRTLEDARAKSELQNSRVLTIVGESASLKAGVQLMAVEPGQTQARLTVEEQLRDIVHHLHFDFLLVSNVDGVPLAGALRAGNEIAPMDLDRVRPPKRGLFTLGANTYNVTSVPIDQGDENIGSLSVGENLDLASFSSAVALTRGGEILGSSIREVSLGEIHSALGKCKQNSECEVRLRGETYLAMPMEGVYSSGGYQLRTLQSIDAAIGPTEAILHKEFALAGVGALLAASVLSAFSSRSIVKPISGVVARLRESERTGVLTEFHTDLASLKEIRELTESFDRAAGAIREGRERLYQAYLEFVGSLASALDARDCYTAGHSRRVSEISCAVGEAANMSKQDLDELRIGALLHDIGKIGIGDLVLQKPGPLTPEEFAEIKLHPTIGRKILEGVNGFQMYLPIVELHHEDWDGTGYPRHLRGEDTPLGARIVHVSDAYDAMTSDRPYRRGMKHEKALRLIQENAGTQFDPAVVAVFLKVAASIQKLEPTKSEHEAATQSIEQLAAALENTAAAVRLEGVESTK